MIPSPAPDTSAVLPVSYVRRHGLFIDASEANTIAYITPTTSSDIILECQRVTSLSVELRCISNTEFLNKVNQYYESASSGAKEISDTISEEEYPPISDAVQITQDLLDQSEENAPVIRLINAVMVDAIKQRASDIHIETYGDYFSIRYRVDGVLLDIARPNKSLANALVSRIKVMANMDIAEKRTPQDGSISVTLAHREVDVRISTLPTRHGERVVMRLLNRQAAEISLDTIGINKTQNKELCSLLAKPQGLILITGPTGSGKSTTLYAGLKQLDTSEKNVLTVEDPIEYELPSIGQTQVNVKAGMTFSMSLRAILRQDPDIVMIGEIRDPETAKTAIQASLTGHLVMSTLHTNTAIGAITRLVDMGVEPYLLSSTLEAAIGQRLVRVLCMHCRGKRSPTSSEEKLLNKVSLVDVDQIYVPKGCERCNNKGFLGRTGIYEIILIDETMRELIHKEAAETELTRYVAAQHRSMAHDGFTKVINGITTLEEVMRVASI